MFIKDLENCEEIIAADNTILREVLHPDKADIKVNYSLAHAKVKIGKASKLHKLSVSEVYYIIEGQGTMHIKNESSEVKANQAIYIPPNAIQYIENIGDSDLIFLALVNPAWQPEYEG